MKVAQADIVGSTAVTATRKAVRRRFWPVARAKAQAGKTALEAQAAFSQPMAVIWAAVVFKRSAGRMQRG